MARGTMGSGRADGASGPIGPEAILVGWFLILASATHLASSAFTRNAPWSVRDSGSIAVALLLAGVGITVVRRGGTSAARTTEAQCYFLAMMGCVSVPGNDAHRIAPVAMIGVAILVAHALLERKRAVVCNVASAVGYFAALLGGHSGVGDTTAQWFAPACLFTFAGLMIGRLCGSLRSRLTQLDHSAHADPLTGLANRKMFLEHAEWALGLAKRTKQNMAVMLIDLDHFKEINDTLGHHAGDLLLQMVGPRLRGGLRSTDLIARLGGDEFAVVLPEVSDGDAALVVANKLVASLVEPFRPETLHLSVGASIGVAMFPLHGDRLDLLMKRADIAMYTSKESRNMATLFADRIDDTSNRGAVLGAGLRRAMSTGELRVNYQPKLHLATGRILGVEALAAWVHNSYGWVLPEEFVPIAERNGAIAELDVFVLRNCLAQCRSWLDQHHLRLGVSANVSARTLADPGFVDFVAGQLAETGVPAALLTLEISELVFAHEPVAVKATVQRLRGLGVRVALDAFGSGCSSLADLRGLCIDEVKIDRSFLGDREIGSDAPVLAAVIQLAISLGTTVVADGVEAGATLRTLRSLGCEFAQGAVISKPLAPDQLINWLGLRAYSSPRPRVAGLPAGEARPIPSVLTIARNQKVDR